MCPDHRGIRDGGVHNVSVDPFSDIRARSPIAPRSREQGIEEMFGFAGLLKDVVVPPQSSVKGEAQVLGRGTVGDRVTSHSKSPVSYTHLTLPTIYSV